MSFDHVLDALALRPSDRLPEIGCGGGEFMPRALRSGCEATAVDHSPDMMQATANLNTLAVIEGRLQVRQGYAASLPFADGTFTAVACLNAFFFFLKPNTVLLEFRRVLRPTGRVVILTAPLDLAPQVRFAAGPLASRMRFDTADAIRTMAMAAGFEAVEASTARNDSLLVVARPAKSTLRYGGPG